MSNPQQLNFMKNISKSNFDNGKYHKCKVFGLIPENTAQILTVKWVWHLSCQKTKPKQTHVRICDTQSPTPSHQLRQIMLKAALALKFPGVETISTDDLSTKIVGDAASSNESKLVILDVRPEAEYNVSHVSESVRTMDVTTGYSAIPETGDVTVVCYCSLGYRSGDMVQQLKKHIKENNGNEEAKRVKVYNLDGGLFQWANEGRDMKDVHGDNTIYAHPYSAVWQHYLHRDLRREQAK